jgi:hypothetical protein
MAQSQDSGLRMTIMPIKLDDQSTWPLPGSIWRHRNGNSYRVNHFTNVEQDRQDEYPTMIDYSNVHNRKRYSRKLIDWDRSMKPEMDAASGKS